MSACTCQKNVIIFLFREQHGDKVGTSDSKGWSNDFFIDVGKLNNKGQFEQIWVFLRYGHDNLFHIKRASGSGFGLAPRIWSAFGQKMGHKPIVFLKGLNKPNSHLQE